MTSYPDLEKYLQQLNIRRDEFTSQEKLVLNKIMSEIEKTGHSKLLDSLWYEDYEEIPIPMKQFLTDTNYLGNATMKDKIPGEAVWPSWRQTLCDIFAPERNLTLVILSGAIGTGKSTVACIGINYIVYKLLCLKDPASYYNIMPNSKPGIALFNITLTKGEGVAFHKINSAFRSSPWFLAHGQEVGNTELKKIYMPDKDITIGIGSDASHFIGLDIFSTMMDEVAFKDNKEIDMMKMKAYNIFTEINSRMESRFQDQGQIPGMSFLVSSTRHEDDFLVQLKEREKGKPNVEIIEKPLWEAVPPDRYRGPKFNLVISNKSTNAFICDDEEEMKKYEAHPDYDCFKPPIEERQKFEDDIMGAIKNILGRPLKTVSRFLIADKVTNSIRPEFINCLNQTEIKLGFDDGTSILDHLEIERINAKLIKYPLFIHHDLALGSSAKADSAGFYISAVAHDIARDDLENKDETVSWTFLPVLWCLIKSSRQGEQIPFYKIRDAVKVLRDLYGFNIMGISADGYQSVDMLQQYELMGFPTFRISMDVPPAEGYMFFRSSLYQGKIFLPEDDILTRELVKLIENRAIGKVDHPQGGSKDLADGCAGSIYCSVQYNKKAKRKIFEDGGYLLSDVITGTRDNKKTVQQPTEIDISRDVDAVLRDIGKGLFADFDEMNNRDDDGFSIY